LTEGVLLEMTTTKWKMAGLALVFSGLLSGGAMVLARGPGDAPTESERLRAVEMRLDRVLRALESAGQSGVAPTVPAPRPTATPLEPPAAESNRGTGVIGGDDAGWFHLNLASGTANHAFAALMAWQSQTNARLEKLGAQVESGVVTVNLVATKVTDDDLSTLSVFSNLQQLYLHHTAIGDPGLANLKTSYRLTTLDVFDTRVTDAGLEHLSEWLPHLERLYLSDTQVTDSGLKFLKGLTHLRLLDVRKTKVTAAGVAEIRKALPRAEVLD
jgi:hypothetical protein